MAVRLFLASVLAAFLALLIGCAATPSAAPAFTAQEVAAVREVRAEGLDRQFLPVDSTVVAEAFRKAIDKTTPTAFDIEGSIEGINPRGQTVIRILQGVLWEMTLEHGYDGVAGQADMSTDFKAPGTSQ
jgi:hypothetical protein